MTTFPALRARVKRVLGPVQHIQISSLQASAVATCGLARAGDLYPRGMSERSAESLRGGAARAPLRALARADRAAARAAAASPDAWAAFLQDEAAAPVARYVLRTLAAERVDEVFLRGGGDGGPWAAASGSGGGGDEGEVGGDGYELDAGMLPDDGQGGDEGVGGGDSGSVEVPDARGVYLLLDADALVAARGEARIGIGGGVSLSPSPCASPGFGGPVPAGSPATPQTTPKRPRRVDAGVVSARFGDFVNDMHALCEAAREAGGNGSATRSGAKAGKAPSRREAASAANVVEELVGIEAKARVGKYGGRVEDVIAEVRRCVENQSATFAEVLPDLNEKAEALREVVGQYQRRAKVLDELRAASVGVLGTAGLREPGSDDGEEEEEGREGAVATPPVLVLEENGEGGGLQMKHDDVVDAAAGEGGGGGGVEAAVPAGGERGFGGVSGVGYNDFAETTGDMEKEKPSTSSVMPFPLVSPRHVQAACRFGQLAADAAAADTLAGVEAAWLRWGVDDDNDPSALAPTMAEFANLAAASGLARPISAMRKTDDVLRGTSRIRGDRLAAFRSAAGTSNAVAEQTVGDASSAVAAGAAAEMGEGGGEVAKTAEDPILATFHAIGRIRDLRKQIFDFFDEASKPKGPSVEKMAKDNIPADVKPAVGIATQPGGVTVKVEPGLEASQVMSSDAAAGAGGDGVTVVDVDTAGDNAGGAASAVEIKTKKGYPLRSTANGVSASQWPELVIRNEQQSKGLDAGAAQAWNADAGADVNEGDDIGGGPRQLAKARAATSLLLAHAGFAEASDIAINILTELMGECIERIGRSLSSTRARRGIQHADVVKRKSRRRAEQVPGKASAPVSDADAAAIEAELGYVPPERVMRTREETFELVRVICSTGFRGGYPELQEYIGVDIPRVTMEVRDAEEKVRNKMTEFAALSGSHLPAAAASAAPMASDAPAGPLADPATVPQPAADQANDAAATDAATAVPPTVGADVEMVETDSADVMNPVAPAEADNHGAAAVAMSILPMDDAARIFGALAPGVRLDVVPGVRVPPALIARALGNPEGGAGGAWGGALE